MFRPAGVEEKQLQKEVRLVLRKSRDRKCWPLYTESENAIAEANESGEQVFWVAKIQFDSKHSNL